MYKNKTWLVLITSFIAFSLFACLPRGGPGSGSNPEKTPSAVATSAPALTTAVEDTPTPGSLDQDALANTRWELVSMGKPGAEIPLIRGTKVTLEFNDTDQAGGSAGCNSYGTRFQLQEGKISFGEIESTAMACEDQKIMDQEQRYLQALQSAGEVELEGDELVIWSEDRQNALYFTRTLPETPVATQGAASSLANTQWALESFGDASTAESVIAGTKVTLQFDGQGRASGSGGCNSFGADYYVQGSSLSFSPIISTKMACMEEGVGAQEQRYFEALQSAERFELSEGRLVIYFGDEQGTLTFVKEGGNP